MQPSRNSFLHHEYLRYVWTVIDAGHGQRPGTYYQVWITSNRSTGAPPQTLQHSPDPLAVCTWSTSN